MRERVAMVEPIRRCAGCGRKTEKSKLLRACRLPDSTVVFDPEQSKQGRSLYFCPNIDCFEKMLKRRAPEKLMKAKLPDDVRDAIKSFLTRSESVI